MKKSTGLTLAALTADPANRRSHGERNLTLIADALREVGAARSIVVDEANVILAGNGVVQAARDVGLKKLRIVEAAGDEVIAVRRVGLTDAQKRALALYDNRTAELATWNVEQLLADQQAGLDLAPFWTDEELAALLNGTGAPKAGLTDPDAVPEVRATDIQRGDLFELGAHRLLCGDSTVAADVARVLPEPADAVVTDPPYGVGVEYGEFKDTEANVRALISEFMPIVLGLKCPVALTPGIPAIWFYPRPTWLMAWVHPAPNGSCPWGFAGLNPILVYGADPYLAKGLGRRPDSIVQATDRAGVDGHPTPKPIKVWSWLVERLTPASEMTVFDPFAGSGTTLIAAEQLGRACRAIEIEPPYCQVTLDRWEAFTGQRAHKVGEAVRPQVTRSTVTSERKTKGKTQPPAGRGRRAARARQ